MQSLQRPRQVSGTFGGGGAAEMHTLTIVLLPRDTPNLYQAGSDLLKRHRIDWDDVHRPSRLDYSTVGGESIADEESAAALGVAGDLDVARNVCIVSRLRPDFVPGAVVTPDGRWYDLPQSRAGAGNREPAQVICCRRDGICCRECRRITSSAAGRPVPTTGCHEDRSIAARRSHRLLCFVRYGDGALSGWV
jgi:hypothetical protein